MTTGPAPVVRIVQLPAAALQALAGGDLPAAGAAAPVPLTPRFVSPDQRGVWRRRAAQVRDDATSAAWITGVVLDEVRSLPVGRAGFHGPPDAAGMVEVGYAIDPGFRRRGYARAALQVLLRRAAREPDVRTVRASVAPDNIASTALVLGFGLVRVGEQVDEEDGLELVYELDPRTAG